MSDKINELQNCNPIFITNTNDSYEDTTILLDIYLNDKKNYEYYYDVERLLKQYKSLCCLYTEISNADLDMNMFTQRFNDLLNELENSTDDSAFWRNINILDNLILKVSSVRECRQLIMINLNKILTLLKTASVKAKEVNSTDFFKWQIVYYYVSNKFKENSSVSDEALFTEILKRCFSFEKPDVEIFILLSTYKNCNKFDLTWQDLLSLFDKEKSKNSLDNFWIYIPYVLKYKLIIRNELFQFNGDKLYDNWFSYCLSESFMQECIGASDTQIKVLLENQIASFNDNDIFTYDSSKLINKVLKERRVTK
jgi:hypothetical protein